MELSPGAQKRHDARTPRGEFGLIQRVLLENEDWYWDLVQHSQDILGIHDLQGRVLSINPLPARVLGYSVEELLQIPLRHIVAEQFRPQFDQYLKQIATASECHGYLTVMTRSGERRIWQYHSSVRTEGVAEPVVPVWPTT